jgi:hypothetical protein
MSTKAGTMGFSGRPALFTFWTVAVSVLAAAALILSAVALNVAARGDRSVTSVEGSGTRNEEALIIAYDRALRQRDRLLKEWDRPGEPAHDRRLSRCLPTALALRQRTDRPSTGEARDRRSGC